DPLHGREEGVQHGDDFATAGHATRANRELERVGARAHADRMLRPDVRRELLVERADIRSDGELHAVEDFVDRLAHVVTDRGVLRAKVDERDLLRCYGGHVLIAPSFIRPPSRAWSTQRARSASAM